MTTAQLKQQFKGLLSVNPPYSEIEKFFLKAVQSQSLDYADEDEDSYRTAKIIYHAILSQMASDWKPSDPENRMESEKLKNHL